MDFSKHKLKTYIILFFDSKYFDELKIRILSWNFFTPATYFSISLFMLILFMYLFCTTKIFFFKCTEDGMQYKAVILRTFHFTENYFYENYWHCFRKHSEKSDCMSPLNKCLHNTKNNWLIYNKIKDNNMQMDSKKC